MALEIWGTSDPNISAQLALAVQMDLFQKDAGLDVSCKFFESGTTMPADILRATQKPFAFIQTPITAILLHENGVSSKVVAPLADIAGTQQVILHPDSEIHTPKDLEGKRIGIARGAAVYMAISHMAQDYDIDMKQITFVDLLPHEQLTEFRAGTLDAIACWEPWTTKARALGGRLYFSGVRSEISNMESDVNWLIDQSCLMVPDEHLTDHIDEVVTILHVLYKATTLLNEHRQEVTEELAGFFGVKPRELVAVMRKNLYSMKFDNLFRIGILGFRDFLYHEGHISRKYPESLLYDAALLRHIDPALVTLEETASQDVSVIGRAQIYYREDVTIVGGGLDARFLVVDDSVAVRHALKQMIDILGGGILGEASTGQEAIEMFTELQPNFVTMDLSMPGMSGIDAIQRILKIAPNTNIIVISNTNLEELREEVFDMGVKIFLVKPFDPLQVAEIIGLLLL